MRTPRTPTRPHPSANKENVRPALQQPRRPFKVKPMPNPRMRSIAQKPVPFKVRPDSPPRSKTPPKPRTRRRRRPGMRGRQLFRRKPKGTSRRRGQAAAVRRILFQ